MTKNPFTNALAAIAYIIIVASIMRLASTYASHTDDTLFAPMAMISLLTLSAAVMGYVFLGQPLQLYLDGKKKEAVNLFSRTLAVFAGLTVVVWIIFFASTRF